MSTRGRRLVAAAAVVSFAMTGCGSASPSSPPTGVDGLIIPTPDPDPADFVDSVDNPWLPLAPGTSWEYDADPATPGPTLTLAAEAGPELDGVRTTTLVRTGADGVATRDHYAQDDDGNVWWFGRDLVGFDEPGLAMPADPRFGDGFRMASAPGLDVTARVVAVDDAVTVPQGSFRPVVVLEVTEAGSTRVEAFAREVGPVQTGQAGLVRRTSPAG